MAKKKSIVPARPGDVALQSSESEGMVSIPRALFDEMSTALSTAVDVVVAIQALCEMQDDGMTHGATYAVAACIEKLENAACDVIFKVREVPLGTAGSAA